MELLIGSRRQAARGTARTREVTSPFDGSTVGTVALAGTADVLAGRRPAAVADPGPDSDHHRKATA
ncbi:hypothetical protein [Streptomyces sp. NPDC054804]